MFSAKNLHFHYTEQVVLRGLTIELTAGEIVGFLGDNGSGKTTALSIMTGLMRPSQGSVEWNGTTIWDDPMTYRQQMGYVPDVVPLFAGATVWEHLTYAAKLRQLDPIVVEQTLEELELLPFATHPVERLSKGWRQWVGIAQGWLHRPKILFLDEPTAGLDPSGRARFEVWIQSIRAAGHTVFFSSHIVREVNAVSDRVLLLKDGQVVASSVPETMEWLIVCTIARLDTQRDVVQKLREIPAIQTVEVKTNQLHITCTTDCRADIARSLAPFDLLEMRQVK